MECYPSKIKNLRLLFLSLLMAAASYYCTTPSVSSPEDVFMPVVGWLGTVLFGLGVIIASMKLLQKGPVLIVDENGITDKRFYGLIPWDDMESLQNKNLAEAAESMKTGGNLKVLMAGAAVRATETKTRGMSFIFIKVRDPEMYISRLKGRQRFWAQKSPLFASSTLCIGFLDLTPGMDEVWNYIKTIHPEKIVQESGIQSF